LDTQRNGEHGKPWHVSVILFLFFLGILSGIGYGFDSLGDRIHSLFPPTLAVNIRGHADIRVPTLSRTISGLAPSRSIWLECVVRKLRKYPLLLESAESESLLSPTEGACGVPRSQQLRETTGLTLQSSKTNGGLTTSLGDPKTVRATLSPTFHTHWREVMKFENVSSQESGRSIVIDFQMCNIHTGWYVGCTQGFET
jgi:hypothetical protein